MSPVELFDLGKLTKGTKITMLLLTLIGVAGGTALGWGLNTWTSEKSTTIEVEIAAGFGVEIVQGTTVTHPFDAAINVGALGMLSIKISTSDYENALAYLKAHPTEGFTPDTATAMTGNEWHTFALTQEIVSKEFLNLGGTPETTDSFDGRKHVFDNGHYVVMPFFYVSCHIGGSAEDLAFTFQSVIDFMDAVNGAGADYTTFSNTQFLKGENHVTINELVFDEIDSDLSTLRMTFNGSPVELVIGNL